jgi:hypothetical protein
MNKENSIFKLFNLLKSHKKNVMFIVVNFGEDLYDILELKFVNLPVNYNVSFVDSKQFFTKELYDFVTSLTFE